MLFKNCILLFFWVLFFVSDILSHGVLDNNSKTNERSSSVLSNEKLLCGRINILSNMMFESNQTTNAKFLNEVEDISYDIRDALLEDCDIGVTNDIIHNFTDYNS